MAYLFLFYFFFYLLVTDIFVDGDRLFSVSLERIKVWNKISGVCEVTLEGEKFYKFYRFVLNGDLLIIQHIDGDKYNVIVWNKNKLEKGKKLVEFDGRFLAVDESNIILLDSNYDTPFFVDKKTFEQVNEIQLKGVKKVIVDGDILIFQGYKDKIDFVGTLDKISGKWLNKFKFSGVL